jgi:hypothetical protein
MITIAVTAGILVFVWSMSAIPIYDRSSQYERPAEEVTIDVVWFYGNGTVAVTIRNVGAEDARIGVIYVDGVEKYSADEGYLIPAGSVASFTLEDVSQDFHLFMVVTSKGSEAHGQFGPI